MGATIRSFPIRWTLGVLILASMVPQVAAQEVTGALQGTVVSPEGKPEPEVHISVSGPHLQGTRETTSNRNGFFQLLLLPPGRYILNTTRQGLQPLEVREIVVQLGRTTAVGPLTLETRPIEMKPVEAMVPRLSLDPVHTTAGGVLDAKDYSDLPVERDYKSLIAVLPQINDSHRGDPLNVAGSTGLENMYYIDGVNVTDTRYANRATSLPYDFVRQVDVKTGGYEAQYGRALGAVVNAVTYSGTNDLEATVFGFVQPDQWAADPRIAPVVTETDAINYDYGARVSGPVLRDRLWFSAAVNPRVDRVDKEITGLGFYPDETSAVRFAGKLTWRANPATNIELSVFGDPTVRDQVGAPPSGITTVLNPDPLLSHVESGGSITSLRATVAPTRSLLLQASLATQQDRYSIEGATPTGRSEPVYWDFVEGATSGGFGSVFREDRDRTSLMLRGTVVFTQHTIVGGADYEDAEVTSDFELTDIGQISRVGSALYSVNLQSSHGTFHNRCPAVYLQDTWRPADQVTLNLGLRWSGQFMEGASGHIGQRIADEWQPRAGFIWQLGKSGTQRIFGSYGRVYQTLPANLAVEFLVDYAFFFSYYSTDPRQPGAIPDTVYDLSTTEAYYAKQIPGLHAENFDEYTLGYERMLDTQNKLTVRGMRRNLRSSFQQGMDYPQSTVGVLGTPGRGDFSFLPPPKREYTALEVAAEGAWRKLKYRASYVLSRNWGNYPGLYDSDGSATNPGGVSTFFFPYQSTNSTGLLPNDHTHIFKLSAAYVASSGLSSGTFLTLESGSPINDFAAGPGGVGPAYPCFLVPRGTAGRTPVLWNLDLRLAYELTPARMPRVRVQLDILHVGNPRGAIRVDELHYGTLDDSGNPDMNTPNPNYKHPIAYQPPMAVRIGVQASF
jgi:hypothetical protein